MALLPPQTGPGCSPLLHGWMGTRSWAPSIPTLSAHDLPPPGCWAKGRGVDWSPTLGSIQSSSLSRPPWEQLKGRELCPLHRVPKIPPWPDSFFCCKASFSIQVETDSIRQSAVYEALHTHKALALPPPPEPQQADGEQDVLRRGPRSPWDRTQREEPGPGANGATWERSGFLLALINGTAQQPTH